MLPVTPVSVQNVTVCYMPELNATQAAQLFGKSRMTIHRYVTTGRLSSRLDVDGKRLIDLSELIRVFGEPNRPVTPVTPAETASVTGSDTDGVTSQQELLEELKALRKEMALLRESIEVIKALPAPIQPAPLAQPPKTKASSFADLLDALDGFPPEK